MEKIKLPRSSYEELIKIINAYGQLAKPSSLSDVSKATGIGESNVSANNAFLNNVGIIEGASKKVITTKGQKLARALEHNIEEEIPSAWSDIIKESDFLTRMLQAVKIRRGMDISQLENHIAFSSGEKKSNYVMTGARAVVDILLSSKMLIQEGDKINVPATPTFQSENDENEKQSSDETYAIKKLTISNQPNQQSNLSINIELRISANPNELDGLGSKIKKIIDELTEA